MLKYRAVFVVTRLAEAQVEADNEEEARRMADNIWADGEEETYDETLLETEIEEIEEEEVDERPVFEEWGVGST